jgi:predicted Zn-dependent protease
MRIINVILCLLFILIFFSNCAVNPVTGKNELMLVSEAQELSLGTKYDKEIVKEYGLYNDKKLNNYILSVGKKLLKYVHRPNLKYHFRVVDRAEVNAFAIPGGYVYVTRGLLAYLNNEAQLAGVLGHELGHINARHSAKQMTKSIFAQLGLTVGAVAFPQIENFSNIISEGVKLLFLKFSRDDEKEADYLGAYYSSNAGYDSYEMANFFKTLERLTSKGKGRLPEWFSTHPSPVNRIIKVRNQTKDIQKKLHFSNYIIKKRRYLSKINGLIFGNNPLDGYREKGYFYHPVLKFKFRLPDNWKMENSPQKVILISDKKDSAIIFHVTEGNFNNVIDKYLSHTALKTYSYKKIKVNGYNAVKTISILKGKNFVVISYFILKQGNIYQFDSIYKNYNEKYRYIPLSFSNIKNLSKLKKKPERIFIAKVKYSSKLKNILHYYGITDPKQIDKISLINGKFPETFIKKGEWIKIIYNDGT